MTGPRRMPIVGLMTILAILVVEAQIGTIWAMPRNVVDLEAPLRAADRWLDGATPPTADAVVNRIGRRPTGTFDSV